MDKKMDKKKEINFNLNNFLLATAHVFDIYLDDLYNTNKLFLRKSAFLSIKIGEALGFEDEKLSDLCSLALAYNLGLYHNKDLDFNKFPFNNHENIQELLRIILLIDDLLKKFNFDDSNLNNKVKIKQYLENLIEFDEIHKEIMLAYLEDYVLWCDLKNENDMVYFIYASLSDFTKILKFEELLEFTKYFNTLLNDNSNIVELAKRVCDYYEFEHKDKYVFMIAASLKDIGKIAVKKDIYYKKEKLNIDESEHIKEYPYHTKKVLNNIQGFNDISSLAQKVQERIDGYGYSFGLDAKNISFKDRILQIISVYDSLTQNKPFRKAMKKDEALEVLDELADDGYLDKTIINQLEDVL